MSRHKTYIYEVKDNGCSTWSIQKKAQAAVKGLAING